MNIAAVTPAQMVHAVESWRSGAPVSSVRGLLLPPLAGELVISVTYAALGVLCFSDAEVRCEIPIEGSDPSPNLKSAYDNVQRFTLAGAARGPLGGDPNSWDPRR